MKFKSLKKLIGNVLITTSLLLLIFTYYPLILSYFPFSIKTQIDTNTYIEIPKINAISPLIENIDPWNPSEYEPALKNGVAKAKNLPNFYFAHSSLPPWEMTRINTPFLRLGELNVGDEIIVTKNGVKEKFKVISKKELWPNETEAVYNSENLILQTCTPVGTSLKRLLVFADKM